MITSVSKLKRKLVSNIQSPTSTQDKQARVASCEKHASHPVEASRPKRGLVSFYWFVPKILKMNVQWGGCTCLHVLFLKLGLPPHLCSPRRLQQQQSGNIPTKLLSMVSIPLLYFGGSDLISVLGCWLSPPPFQVFCSPSRQIGWRPQNRQGPFTHPNPLLNAFIESAVITNITFVFQ